MCGIVGLIGHQITTTEEKTNEILDVMEHRGRDNRGIVSIKDDEVIRCTILLEISTIIVQQIFIHFSHLQL